MPIAVRAVGEKEFSASPKIEISLPLWKGKKRKRAPSTYSPSLLPEETKARICIQCEARRGLYFPDNDLIFAFQTAGGEEEGEGRTGKLSARQELDKEAAISE